MEAAVSLTLNCKQLFAGLFLNQPLRDTVPDTVCVQALTWFESTLSGIQFRDPLPNRRHLVIAF